MITITITDDDFLKISGEVAIYAGKLMPYADQAITVAYAMLGSALFADLDDESEKKRFCDTFEKLAIRAASLDLDKLKK